MRRMRYAADMKKTVVFVGAGAALFAAGYFTRSTTHPAAEADTKAGPVAAAVAGQSGPVAGAAGDKAAEQSARKFTPGRPFPKGGAKLWLLSLASLDFDDESRISELLEVVQQVMTMDEECTKEMADALMEIAQLIENDDPSLKGSPNADELVEGGIMLAMMRLSQFSPDAALELMKKYPEAADGMSLLFVFGKLTSQNPQRAEEMALSMPEESRRNALQAIVKTFSSKDPRSALALAQKHAEAAGHGIAHEVLIRWAQREPQQAMPEAVKMTAESGNSSVVRRVFHNWMQRDEQAALAWAATHEGAGKTALEAILLERRAKTEEVGNLLADFTKLAQSAANQDDLGSLAGVITGKMAEKDIGAAKTWVQDLPNGKAKDAAIHQLVEHWVVEDAESASAWIKELPPGDGRDAAALQLSDKILRRDPAAALEWVRSIRDEDQRKDRVNHVLSSWREQDPEAAEAARLALPEELRSDWDDMIAADPFATPPPPPAAQPRLR